MSEIITPDAAALEDLTRLIRQGGAQEGVKARIQEGEGDLREDLEVLVLDVMEEEFGVVLEDGSERDVVGEVLRFRRECLRGESGGVAGLRGRWEAKGGDIGISRAQGDEGESSESGSDEGERDGDGDVGMADATRGLGRKVEPEVDDEGFVKVDRRKR